MESELTSSILNFETGDKLAGYVSGESELIIVELEGLTVLDSIDLSRSIAETYVRPHNRTVYYSDDRVLFKWKNGSTQRLFPLKNAKEHIGWVSGETVVTSEDYGASNEPVKQLNFYSIPHGVCMDSRDIYQEDWALKNGALSETGVFAFVNARSELECIDLETVETIQKMDAKLYPVDWIDETQLLVQEIYEDGERVPARDDESYTWHEEFDEQRVSVFDIENKTITRTLRRTPNRDFFPEEDVQDVSTDSVYIVDNHEKTLLEVGLNGETIRSVEDTQVVKHYNTGYGGLIKAFDGHTFYIAWEDAPENPLSIPHNNKNSVFERTLSEIGSTRYYKSAGSSESCVVVMYPGASSPDRHRGDIYQVLDSLPHAIVYPETNMPSYEGGDGFDTARFQTALNQLTAEYENVYLFGHSAGGPFIENCVIENCESSLTGLIFHEAYTLGRKSPEYLDSIPADILVVDGTLSSGITERIRLHNELEDYETIQAEFYNAGHNPQVESSKKALREMLTDIIVTDET